MKILITYSSATGNTKKVAEAIRDEFNNAQLLPMIEVVDVSAYDLIVIGGWIDKGQFNKEAIDFCEKLTNKRVAFFFTIGVFPATKHGIDAANNIKKLLEKGNNEVINHFHCQGAIAPKIVDMFLANVKDTPAYEKLKLKYAYAANHPNEEDLFAAKHFAGRTEEVFKNGEINPHGYSKN